VRNLILLALGLAVTAQAKAAAPVKCSGNGHTIRISTNDLVDSVALDEEDYGSCDRSSSSTMVVIRCEKENEHKSLQLILDHSGGRITGVSLGYVVGNISYGGDGSGIELGCKI
jgi:hypothetical protein